MNRVINVVLLSFGLFVFTLDPFGQSFNETLLSEKENANNPIPSPDGKMIAFVRTGRWEKGSGGQGRSNLRSEIMVMDDQGHLLTDKPLADAFLAGWTSDGKNLVCYRDYKYFLVSLDGRKSRETEIPSEQWSAHDKSERGTYLPSIDEMIFVQNSRQSTRGIIRTVGKEIAQNDTSLGKMLVPSPDGRYIAAIDITRLAQDQLWVYDTQNNSWANLGKATIHPDITQPNNEWDWVNASWNPWYADSSHLAFVSGSTIVVSTPDGKSKQVITEANLPIGLATPSPDGKFIAYVTFDAKLNKEQPQHTFWGNTTVWVAPVIPGAKARPVTKKATETTWCLRWLNTKEIVFDRMPYFGAMGNDNRLWRVRVE